VPPDNWERLQSLCAGEDVEATAIGTFEATGRLRLFYEGNRVADLDLHFLHEGRPVVVRQATWKPPHPPAPEQVGAASRAPAAAGPARVGGPTSEGGVQTETLLHVPGSLNVCSKEPIIRQYDHEVQGGSVVKPLVGVGDDGPSDAAVVMPVLDSWQA